MTFGQLFTTMHPDVRAIENGSCVWLFMDEVNHYTIANEWWNQEVTGYALEQLKGLEAQTVLSNRCSESAPCRYIRKGLCPKCHQEVEWLLNRSYCGFCGQAVKWDGKAD